METLDRRGLLSISLGEKCSRASTGSQTESERIDVKSNLL